MPPDYARSFAELTAKILAHADKLSTGYQPHDLHQFRVGIRRTRSLLKQLRLESAGEFSRAWGGFFAVTGQARDFDVFENTASRLLTDSQQRDFAAVLEQDLHSSHAAVLDMLRSPFWQRHLEDWENYLASLSLSPPESRGNRLPKVRAKARKACRKALAKDNDYRWHRFRIAIKNLRYVADASRAGVGHDAAALDALIADCKVLQTLLGDWHDTIVQLKLINGAVLFPSLADDPGLSGIQASLSRQIEKRRSELLAQVRAFLDTHDLFDDPE